ncbi:MAG: filamentous hemagglutinin N-terminal domain-containing protein, partial [Burkholderiales bacterium]
MNKTYRIVWSDARKAFVVADERAKAKGKPSSSRKAAGQAVIAALLALGGAGQALAGGGNAALPTNGVVAAGTAAIGVNGNAMTVNQATQSAIINWGTFNIGSAASVDFVQPNSSATALNRVLSANPSQIYGSLISNGTVFLVNPQGIVVGPGAQINVGGLVASSLNLSDADFLANKFNFHAVGAPGSVSNAGNINVAPGGFAALLGGQVNNSGLISAKLGSVALASGNQVALSLDDSGLLSVGVKQSAINALVNNSGAILADGGRIVMTAKAANSVLDTVVNNEGILQASSIGERSGQIWMLAADPVANTGATGAAANLGKVQNASGGVASSGTIDVSGNAGATAGQVTIAGSMVDVSGTVKAGSVTSGGGQVLVNSVQGTTIDSSAVIDVSSAAGAGSAILWSSGNTAFHGLVDGQGLGAGGHGATVEISSGKTVAIDGTASLGAQTAANAGTLLIDPATLEIQPGAGTGVGPSYVSQNTLQSESGNIVLSADGQITIDALTNNVLALSNSVTSFSLTSNNTGGIQFLNAVNGGPSGISTNNAPVTLTASG